MKNAIATHLEVVEGDFTAQMVGRKLGGTDLRCTSVPDGDGLQIGLGRSLNPAKVDLILPDAPDLVVGVVVGRLDQVAADIGARQLAGSAPGCAAIE